MTLSGYTKIEDRMTIDRLEQLWIDMNYPNNKTIYDWLVKNNRPFGTMSSARFTKCMSQIRSKYSIAYKKKENNK